MFPMSSQNVFEHVPKSKNSNGNHPHVPYLNPYTTLGTN
jgi:hypothetical protein